MNPLCLLIRWKQVLWCINKIKIQVLLSQLLLLIYDKIMVNVVSNQCSPIHFLLFSRITCYMIFWIVNNFCNKLISMNDLTWIFHCGIGNCVFSQITKLYACPTLVSLLYLWKNIMCLVLTDLQLERNFASWCSSSWISTISDLHYI